MTRAISNNPSFTLREILPGDFEEMHNIRMSVKENILSNPALITESDYIYFIAIKGKGWLAEINNKPVGFAIIDCLEQNIWALFIRPGFDGMGIGKSLHNIMLNWYFDNYDKELWLGTSPGTRAETFYRMAGWKEDGMHHREIKFTMSSEKWKTMAKKI